VVWAISLVDEVLTVGRISFSRFFSKATISPAVFALGIDKAVDELRQGSGPKYDPQIVEVAVRLVSDNNNKIFWSTN